MTLIDLFIIICIVANMLIGYQKGLIWTFIGLSSYLIAVLFSKMFYVEVAAWLKDYTGIFIGIETFMHKNFENFIKINESNLLNIGKEPLTNFGFLEDFIIKEVGIQSYVHQSTEIIKEEIFKGIATFLINVISMILIFLVVKGAIVFIGAFLNQAFKLPVLNTLNKTGGLAMGGIKGVFIIMLTLVLLFVISLVCPSSLLHSSIENSLIIQYFFEDIFPPLMNWLL